MTDRAWFVTGLAILATAGSAFAQPRLLQLDGNRTLFEVDIQSGARTELGVIQPNITFTGALAYDCATGRVFVSSTSFDSVYTLDLETLETTLIGPYGNTSVIMHGLEWHNGLGKLFGISFSSGTPLFEIDTATGTATLIANTNLTGLCNLGYDSDNDIMYALSGATDSLYTIDVTTGVATLVGPLVNSTNPQGLAYNADDGVMYMCDNTGVTNKVMTVNLDTGEATLLGSVFTGNPLGIAYISVGCGGSHDACNVADVAEVGGTAEAPGAPDHQLTVDDLIVFVNLFSDQTGCPGTAPCNRADVTGVGGGTEPPDGQLTVDDLIEFVNAFSEGCAG